MRRRPNWRAVAEMARQTPGEWRLHTSLVACDQAFLLHARRRATPLRPTEDGRFEFRKTNIGEDQLGHPIFDVLVRWVPTREGDQ